MKRTTVTLGTRPLQRPHPPIWVGGHHPAAIRRAAALADGWIGAGGSSAASLAEAVPLLRSAVEEAGRDPATLPDLEASLPVGARATRGRQSGGRALVRRRVPRSGRHRSVRRLRNSRRSRASSSTSSRRPAQPTSSSTPSPATAIKWKRSPRSSASPSIDSGTGRCGGLPGRLLLRVRAEGGEDHVDRALREVGCQRLAPHD